MWTYNTSPGTSSSEGRRDAVRLLLKDTQAASPLFQDEEIEFFLSVNGSNVWRAAADAAEGLSAREAESKSVGDLAISGFGTTWAKVAERYRSRANSRVAPYAGGISVIDKETRVADTDRVSPFFTRNLMNNPEGSSERST